MASMILGIDEVGRGCWAGPLVVGAVVLGGADIDGLTDSKALSKKRREFLNEQICEKALGIGLGWVAAAEIDEIGLSDSLRLATRRAVKSLDCPFHEIIIDGTVNFLRDTPLENHVSLMKKADLLVPSVSAASIVAKVARDHYMTEQDEVHVGYGFKSHVGYGVATHRAAIDRLGVTPEHRLSFAPLAKYAKPSIAKKAIAVPVNSDPSNPETTLSIGAASEAAAARELQRLGHDIIERNWKTKYCEIDIISKKRKIYYFTEVKHRKNDSLGDGIAAITDKKLNQMRYAAKFYAHVKQLSDTDMTLMAISTTADSPRVVSIVKISQ